LQKSYLYKALLTTPQVDIYLLKKILKLILIPTEQLGQQMNWHATKLCQSRQLNTQELHVWCLPLSLNSEEQATAIDWLNAKQRDKFERRLTPQLQQTYLAGRYFMLRLLSAYTDVLPGSVQIAYSRLNKPFLASNPHNIEFNYSDTVTPDGDIGLFALSRTLAVGVDIEALSRRTNFAPIVAKRFSAAESAYVTDPDGEVNAERFLAYWTRKEAYGKATGKGINFKMRELDLASPTSFELDFMSDEKPARAFRLQQIQLQNKYIASLVHENHQPLEIKAFMSDAHIP
jgi:4'-phosphopantetheinyl transferase